MSPDKLTSGSRLPFGTIEKVKNLLSQVTTEEALDILHLLRIRYGKKLFCLSNKTRIACEERIRSGEIPKRAGVYMIVIVNPEGNVILYAGKTSRKSETTGLEFRIRSHVRLLGKTPLTLFIPNWWIRRIYTAKVADGKKTLSLEKRLWRFLVENVKNRSSFSDLHDLENQILKIFHEYIPEPSEVQKIELQPNLNPKADFHLEVPPAGQARGLSVGD